MGYYAKKVTDTIHVTGYTDTSIEYPKSDTGGTKEKRVYFEKDVEISIETYIEDEPFNQSVSDCSQEVNILTGAVITMEAAEIKTKADNANKVGKSLISGFFGYIRSEISQQIAEFKTQADAILGHLDKMGDDCVNKQQQMEKDYRRIEERYSHTFKELNKETRIRIIQLDKPVFSLIKDVQEQFSRVLQNTLLNTATVLGGETCTIQSKICSSGLRQRSLSVLESADNYLRSNESHQKEIQSILQNESGNSTLYAPVVYIETNNDNHGVATSLHCNNRMTAFNSSFLSNEIKQKVQSTSSHWENLDTEQRSRIGDYLRHEIKHHLSAGTVEETRITNLILNFWENSPVQGFSH